MARHKSGDPGDGISCADPASPLDAIQPLFAVARRWEVLAGVLILAPLVVSLLPTSELPKQFPDSVGYLLHQSDLPFLDGPAVDAGRLPAYPLTLDVIGLGQLLSHVQTWLSLGSFALLGWLLARLPGMLVAGLIACSGAIAPWNTVVLTESLTCSAIALCASGALMLGRHAPGSRRQSPLADVLPIRGERTHPPLALSLLWVGLVLYLTLMRDSNLLALPVFSLPFLRYGWRWMVLALIFVISLGAMNTVSANRQGRWMIPYYTALVHRVQPDQEARALFREAGMPRPRKPFVRSEVIEWLEQDGRRFYERWVLTRPASYVEAWNHLQASEAASHVRKHYFQERLPPGAIERLGSLVWQWSGPPPWLWVSILLVPVVELRLYRRISPTGAMAALLVPTTYALAFVSYHAAGTEEVRHLLVASFLYRLGFAFALYALIVPTLEGFLVRFPFSGRAFGVNDHDKT